MSLNPGPFPVSSDVYLIEQPDSARLISKKLLLLESYQVFPDIEKLQEEKIIA